VTSKLCCLPVLCPLHALLSGGQRGRLGVDVVSKPTIVTVDDDPMVSAAITRDLASRYGADYRLVRTTSGGEALGVLTQLALRDQPVALIVADQRMPLMTGVEMLEQARAHAPGAKFLVLTAYADTDVAIKAINDIGLDYYLLKPWDPPEERRPDRRPTRGARRGRYRGTG
jgi:thioredoxin reductase (NADPH)